MICDFDMWRTQIVKHAKEGPTPQLVQEPAEGYDHVFGSIVAGAIYKLEHPHLFSFSRAAHGFFPHPCKSNPQPILMGSSKAFVAVKYLAGVLIEPN